MKTVHKYAVRIENKTYMKFIQRILKSTEIKDTYTYPIYFAKLIKQCGHMTDTANCHISSFVKMRLQCSVLEFPHWLITLT
jgi:hypothetical protein